MISSPIAIKIRNYTRKLGINKLIASLLASKQYEDRFGNAISSQIRSGDIVWDIGANLGIYTQIFLDSVSPNGQVVAFEPAPSCFEKLQQKFKNHHQVKLNNIAIGSQDEISFISLESDPLAATHQVIETDKISNANNVVEIQVRSSDSIIHSEPELIPNIIKIDVEGYEGQVIDGMQHLLTEKKLRCIGIEVHFGLLNERGETNRPQQIESILQKNNFVVNWTDSSHIIATR
jgi:FkbM family methyltransferase